jgi:hypothetical protein
LEKEGKYEHVIELSDDATEGRIMQLGVENVSKQTSSDTSVLSFFASTGEKG